MQASGLSQQHHQEKRLRELRRVVGIDNIKEPCFMDNFYTAILISNLVRTFTALTIDPPLTNNR